MKKNILISLLIIAFSATVISGATLAWFTNEADPIVNEFTAGTVNLSADETVEPVSFMQENWNPGDCAFKQYTIINIGTKSSYIRVIFEVSWFNKDGTLFFPKPDLNVVTWRTDDDNWTVSGNIWYYNSAVSGSYTQSDITSRTITLDINVCLDGPGTDNQYQGKVFILTAQFEAVQSSNNAVDDVWINNPYSGATTDPDPQVTPVPSTQPEPTLSPEESSPSPVDEDPSLPDTDFDCPLWNESTVYLSGDCVVYNGKAFVARNWTRGHVPGLLESPWQEITDEWRFFNVYLQGETVLHNGKIFKARNWSQNSEPGLLESPWQEITDEWRFFNVYLLGETVMHNGILYQAKNWTQNSEPGTPYSSWKVKIS